MRPHSAVIYEGPSRLDGQPIAVIATGLNGTSKNPKTGPMTHLWVLRSDMPPVDALFAGDDVSVCGDCPLRRTVCYVSVIHAPRAVYKAYAAGRYPHMRPADLPTTRPIRMGAYGDPGAVPMAVWNALPVAAGRTGYTHQWTRRPALRRLVMASVDTVEQAHTAQAAGWRTFRVKSPDEPLMAGEIACPASAESGHKTTCDQCLLCDGSTGRDEHRANIAINTH